MKAAPRVPFFIDAHAAGSVAEPHLPALQAWPQWLRVEPGRVTLSAPDRDAALAHVNAALRGLGLVKAWRDEFYAIASLSSGERLARTERAASRLWGTLTLGAHANGYVADATGRPTHLWIAQRSWHKPTDPGMFDNLIGGGVADGQSPLQALVREGWEEAGLMPEQMAPAHAVGVLRLDRAIPEGHQLEDLHAFDLPLPAGWAPVNQDGEVANFRTLPVMQAVQLARSGAMTVDASMVTLDFARRHGFA
jgi:8-oxo-dGTP pyrophosphatase MutT (NUDIX family)